MTLVRADTVWDLVEQRAEATPDDVMVIDEHDRTLTFAEYRDATERAAAGFAERGVREGATVAWQLPTWIESLVLMAALCRLGARQLALLPMYRERELVPLLRRADVTMWCVPSAWRGFAYGDLATRVQAELHALEIVVCDRALPEGDVSQLPPAPDAATGRQPSWIYATSGTTSEPKAALHTDRSIMAGGAAFCLAQGVRPDDRYGVAFPLTHIGGANNLTASLQCGFSIAISETFDPPVTAAGFQRQGVTIAGGGTVFYQALLDVQRSQRDEPLLPKLRFLTGGGAPMPPALHHEVRREMGGSGCAHGYGMTESCMVATNHPDDRNDKLAHTVGRPVPQVALRIVDDQGVDAATHADGEIRIKGDTVFAGYLDEVANAAAWDENGWFRTGDLGHFDGDGYLCITGRAKDIIIRKGENISATELEDLLYEHRAIAEVAVIGLPDRDRGERVCAVIRPHDGDLVTLRTIVEHCEAAGIMRQKFPEQIELVDELPKNATGKVLKAELRARFGAAERS